MQLTFTDLSAEEAMKLLSAIGGKKATRAAPETEEETDPEEPEAPADDASDDGEQLTFAEVSAAFKAYVKRNDGDKKSIIPILKKLGVKSPNEIEEEDYARTIKLLSK